MIFNEKWLAFSIFIGATLFLYGFFPLSYTSNERAAIEDLPDFIDDIRLNNTLYRRHVSRTVFMVIDAMRTDFIQNQQNTSMKYLNKLIHDGSACVVNMNVEVPTVTMPRIKAMTTGTIPNFIDVVMNLGSTELHMDSILHQMHNKAMKMVFLGDNTWVKMFPQMFHRQLENLDSLFVNDFYEGDKNITKHLSVELKNIDWQFLILHYLGLDHIGHVEGPFSPKVPAKLREMDTVIMHIHLALQHSMQSSNNTPLFIITGDHGMRDSGGHGGSSYPEINVPFVFIGPQCTLSNESYNQIDIPATLAVLLGLPIPASCIGVLIPSFLAMLTMEQKLLAYHYNGQHLLTKLSKQKQSYEEEEFYTNLIRAKTAHKTFLQLNASESEGRLEAFVTAELLYILSLRAMSDKLADSLVHFDLISITMGLVCLVTTLLSIVLIVLSDTKKEIRVSPKYALVVCVIATLIHHNVYKHSLIPAKSWGLVLLASIYFIMTLTLQQLLSVCRQFRLRESLQSLALRKPFGLFLALGVVFHGLSAASSSFIEEEHQIWYYLNNTVWILLYVMETKHLMNAKVSTNENEQSYQSVSVRSILPSQLKWIALFCGHLIARRLNQTGDKWLSIPDIGDWLQMEENRTWNSLFMSAALFLTYLTCMDFGSILTNVLTVTACMLIYYYRTLSGSVYFAGIKASESTSACVTLFWLNISEIAAINYVPILYNAVRSNLNRFDVKSILGTLVVLLTLVAALTHKPHNIFLLPLLLFSCRQIESTCSILCDMDSRWSFGPLAKCVLHLWMGKLFFFYQGNSNSLASIDLNAGYVGLNTFHFMAVGFFLTVNTFSGPILSFVTFFYHNYNCSDKSSQRTNTKEILHLVLLLIAFPFTLYVFIILLFRQHIFIWSVFSPKLLYEFYYLCLMQLLWGFAQLIPNVK